MPEFHEFARANAPEHHYDALRGRFLEPLAAEARARGHKVHASGSGLGFTLATVPQPNAPPPGMDLREVDAAWMNAEMANGRFENGVGEVDVGARTLRNKYGIALFENDEPVAVAGVFDTYAMDEIGVDVVRRHRGAGLGKIVVEAAARAIVERNGIPMYFCDATNVRSHRTALTSRFVPVVSDASIA